MNIFLRATTVSRLSHEGVDDILIRGVTRDVKRVKQKTVSN